MEDLYQVGAITQTHGIKGEVKVFPLTDDISRFKNMKNLLLDAGKEGYINLEQAKKDILTLKLRTLALRRILLYLSLRVLIILTILKNTRGTVFMLQKKIV